MLLRDGYDGYGRIRPGPRQGSKGLRSEDTMDKDPRIGRMSIQGYEGQVSEDTKDKYTRVQ